MSEREKQNPPSSWPTPEFTPEELAQKAELFAQRVRAPAPSQTRTVADWVRAFSGMSIQARNLGSCYEVRGYAHYRGSPRADDAALRELYIDRIYDTYMDEVAFAKTDTWIGHVADELPPGAYSSRQFMDRLADRLDDPLSIVATCRKHGVPMFVPALNDSS